MASRTVVRKNANCPSGKRIKLSLPRKAFGGASENQMDGKGFRNVPANELSAPVRLASIVESFDGWSIARPHFGDRDTSPEAVLNRMRTEKMYMFDRELFEAFADMKTTGNCVVSHVIR